MGISSVCVMDVQKKFHFHNMKRMQVCVTGANGFIGRCLVDALSRQGYSIRVLTRRPVCLFPDGVQVIVGDLTSPDCPLDQFLEGCEVIFHCAGEIHDVAAMRLLHINGTQWLLKAVLKKSIQTGKKIHWVQLSSVGAYGSPHGPAKTDRIVTENTSPRPVGEYEVTKTRADDLVIKASESGLMTYSIVRPSNVFGAKMTNQSLFKMIAMIDCGLFFYIGKPGASANYVHVDNVVEGLISCGTQLAARGKVYNLSDQCMLEYFVGVIATNLGRTAPQKRIPEIIARLAGMTLGRLPGFPLTQARIDALVNRSIYPISHIQNELGYRYVISMEDGLRELVDTYKQRLSNGDLK